MGTRLVFLSFCIRANSPQEHWQRQVLDWLSAPDPSTNFDDAQNQHVLGTGSWLLQSDTFENWKAIPQSVLWLYGKPGCGKTILCSSVVESVSQLCQVQHCSSMAYFFFDFTDQSKQMTEKWLCAVLFQLVVEDPKAWETVYASFTQHSSGARQPNLRSLSTMLHSILESDSGRTYYLIIDAVDEASSRSELLDTISEVVNWKLPNVQLFLTSREDKDIADSLERLVTEKIRIHDVVVDADISTYVSRSLRVDQKLRKWPANVRDDITVALTEKSNGMFRWTACQLDTLRKCLKLDQLRKALESLLRTLEDTYVRILGNIALEYQDDAFKILQWLCFAVFPPTLGEMAEVLAVNLDQSRYDEDQRLLDAEDVLLICNGLVTLSDSGEAVSLKLSHYSVKEFLLSNRISSSSQSNFYMEEKLASLFITETCLIYLVEHFGTEQERWSANSDNPPLADYAARFWWMHGFSDIWHVRNISSMAIEVLDSSRSSFLRWLGNEGGVMAEVISPLQYAAKIGSTELLSAFLDKNPYIDEDSGMIGTALCHAAQQGHIQCAEFLLNRSADVNLRCGKRRFTPLRLAAICGRQQVAQFLISRGADLNATSIEGETALLSAVRLGNLTTAQLLLDAGADVSIRDLHGTSPLCCALNVGSLVMATMLIDYGADVNEDNGMPLHIALQCNRKDIFELLLDKYVKLDVRGGQSFFYGMLLNAIAAKGRLEMLRHLIESYDCDLCFTDDQGRTALHVAAVYRQKDVTEYLIKLGLDVNKQDMRGWTAIHYAAATDSAEILRILLPNWKPQESETNAWTPLHLACRWNCLEALELLVRAGVSPTVVTTLQPPVEWTLRDIALIHGNKKLTSDDGTFSHPLLNSEDTRAENSTFTLFKRYHDPEKDVFRVCDGCEHVSFLT